MTASSLRPARLSGIAAGLVLLTSGATSPTSAQPLASATSVNPLVFAVSDAESPEAFVVENPNCPPDIVCRPFHAPGKLRFTVSTNLSFADRTVTVKFRTVDGTALSPGDYRNTIGTLSFPPGVFSRPVDVTVTSIGGVESAETMALELFDPSFSADVSDRGVGTILDGVQHL